MPTLLWQNPNTTLGATTISIPTLKNYRYMEIWVSVVEQASCIINKFTTDDGSNKLICNGLNRDTISDTDKLRWMNFMTRGFTVSGTNITFESGQMQYYGAIYKDWNNRCVPFRIYGLLF